MLFQPNLNRTVLMAHIYKGVVPFVALQWIGLFLCMYYPQIILWIPQLIFGIDAIK
jgi:TRAP-type mannitol/chloroaromatic compound transport system permease large subunit